MSYHPYIRRPHVRVGAVVVPLFGKIDFTDPVFYLRLVPFMGWGDIILNAFDAWGIAGKGADIALHAAPGIIQGDSFSDALMADYGARLKIALGYTTGAFLAGASAAASAALGGTLGTGAITVADSEIDSFLNGAKSAAEREIGKERTADVFARAAEELDSRFNTPFRNLVTNPEFKRLLDDPKISAQGLPTAQSLAKLGLSPTQLSNMFGGIRQDVVALATNALMRQRVYNVSTANFDPITGQQIFASDENRTEGLNSDWALIDLLAAQNSGDAARIASAQDDYDRANKVDHQFPPSVDPNWQNDVLIEILAAQHRGANPYYLKELENKYAEAAGEPSPSAVAASNAAVLPIHSTPARPKGSTTGIGIRHSEEEMGIFGQLLTLGLLTSPVWGPHAYRIARKRWRF